MEQVIFLFSETCWACFYTLPSSTNICWMNQHITTVRSSCGFSGCFPVTWAVYLLWVGILETKNKLNGNLKKFTKPIFAEGPWKSHVKNRSPISWLQWSLLPDFQLASLYRWCSADKGTRCYHLRRTQLTWTLQVEQRLHQMNALSLTQSFWAVSLPRPGWKPAHTQPEVRVLSQSPPLHSKRILGLPLTDDHETHTVHTWACVLRNKGPHPVLSFFLRKKYSHWPEDSQLGIALEGLLCPPSQFCITSLCIVVLCGFWGLNSGPRACKANALLTELFPQLIP